MHKNSDSERLKAKLSRYIKSNNMLSEWITEFFDNNPQADLLDLTIYRKGVDLKKRKSKAGKFDPDAFIERIKKDISKEVQDVFNDNDDFDFGKWVDEYMKDDYVDNVFNDDPGDVAPSGDADWVEDFLETEHHKNRAKRIMDEKNKPHPMERLSDGSDDDRVGIFAIAYVEYLEKQNDLLRKNAGGKNGKRKKSK